MTRITIDSAMWKKLLAIREVAALCDEAGRVVGHFHPGPPRYAQGNAIIPFSDEELDEMSKQTGGRPLKDILDDLSKL
jgi:hypothetical protein